MHLKYLSHGLGMPPLRQSETEAGLISHRRATTEVPPIRSMILLAKGSIQHILDISKAHCQDIPKIKSNKISLMNWKERITYAREEAQLTKSELARRVHVSPATITDWEGPKVKMIDGANLVQLAAVLSVTPEWIITGQGGNATRADAVIQDFARVYKSSTDEGQAFLRSTLHAVEGAYKKPSQVIGLKRKNY